MRPTTRALAIIVIGGLPSLAFAQDRGSEQDQEACTPDVFRLCNDFIPNEGPIVACLQAKRRELSPACLQVMFPAPAASASPQITSKGIRHAASSASKHHHRRRRQG